MPLGGVARGCVPAINMRKSRWIIRLPRRVICPPAGGTWGVGTQSELSDSGNAKDSYPFQETGQRIQMMKEAA